MDRFCGAKEHFYRKSFRDIARARVAFNPSSGSIDFLELIYLIEW